MRRWLALGVLGVASVVLGAASCGHGGTPGHILCKSRNYIDVGSTCDIEYRDCADMHDYRVDCAGGICACFVDDQSKGNTQGLTDCPSDSAEMNDDCGFDITE
jgi:hypothetical protein